MPKCPDGHRWWACAHEELAHPVIGFAMMTVGLLGVLLGVTQIIH